MAKFTDIFDDVTKRGRKIPTNQYLPSGKYPIVDQGQTLVAGYTDEEEGLFEDVPAIIFGDHTRIIKYVDKPCFLGADGVKLLKANFKSANYKYLYYALLNAKIPNTGYNRHFKWLKEVEIPLPEEHIQEKIVLTLEKLDNLISQRKQQLAKLDELVKARFVEMFGTVGTDEKGWGFARLGDVCRINPKKADESRLKSGLQVSFVPMPAVTEKGEIDPSETKKYDEVKSGFTYFREEDVLFAKITPCMENGKGAVAKGLCNSIGFGSTEFHVLRPIENISNPYWIYSVTSFKQFRVDAASNMTGSAGQRRVPASFLESYRISVPPIELQNKFAAFVEQVDKSKVAVKKALDEAQTLFDSLMQQYFG